MSYKMKRLLNRNPDPHEEIKNTKKFTKRIGKKNIVFFHLINYFKDNYLKQNKNT